MQRRKILAISVLIVAALILPAGCRSAESITSKVSMGMTTSEVLDVLGEPDDKQEMRQAGMEVGGMAMPGLNLEMWYYHTGIPFVAGGMVQIAFDDGRVNAINTY